MIMTDTGKYRPITSGSRAGGNPQNRHDSTKVFKQERDNFRRMKSELCDNPEFQNNYVAIHENIVVGKSKSRIDLYFEMSKKYPDGTYFIGKVYPPN